MAAANWLAAAKGFKVSVGQLLQEGQSLALNNDCKCLVSVAFC